MTFDFFLPQKSAAVKNIYLHLSFFSNTKAQKFTFRTPLRIASNEWENDKQRPKNIYLKKNKRLNIRLDEIKTQLAEYIRSKKESPSHRALHRKVQEICSSETVPPHNSLLYYTQLYVSSRKELICTSTYKRYQVFLRLLARFEGFLCKKLFLYEINTDFVREFMRFGKEEAYSESTIYRTIHFVKTILHFAERKGIKTASRELELRKEKTQKEVITLKEDELQKVKETDVPEELKPVRDWLLISCYTGQRISDFMNFDTTMIEKIEGKNCLSFIQQKTGKSILLPVHPEVYTIIERNGLRFPPKIPVHIYNTQVKEVARIAGIYHPVMFNKRQGHRAAACLIPKWKAISSHIGRRSFASNFYGKIPTPLLMEATGHSTEQMFQKYISITDPSRVLELGLYFEKIYRNKKAKRSLNTI